MRFVDIGPIVLSQYNNKNISISNQHGSSLKFQIPRMYMPFGVSGFKPQFGNTKWNIDFSMKGYDEDGSYVNKFYNFVLDIEEKIVKHVYENSVDIFGTQLSFDELKNMFNSNIKLNGNYEPKFRVKYDKTIVFDVNDNECTPDEVSDGDFRQHSGVGCVEVSSVYFLNKMFGVTWKLTQLKVFEPQRLHGFMFKDV